MPREVRIIKWCQPCWLDDEQSEATGTFLVGIIEGEGARPPVHLIDTCETHGKELSAMQEMIRDAELWTAPTAQTSTGRPVGSGAGAPKESIECRLCHIRFAKTSLRTHIYSQHVFRPAPLSPTSCPTCHENYTSGVACSQHRVRTHGFDSVEEAYSQVPADRRVAVRQPTAAEPELFETSLAHAYEMAGSPGGAPSGVTGGLIMDTVVADLQQHPDEWRLIAPTANVSGRKVAFQKRGAEVEGRNMVKGVGELWARWPVEEPE